MIWIELLILATVFGAAAIFYRLGKRDGYSDGWFDGHQHATDKVLAPEYLGIKVIRGRS